MADFKLDPNYNDVAARLRDLKEKHPEASCQPLHLDRPFWFERPDDDHLFLVYAAACYRHPEDLRPGIGIAWEPFPGRTPYTRDSEVMVAETSAWGRAIVAALAADTKKGVASADEIAARQVPVEAEDVARSREAVQEAIAGLTDGEKELVRLEMRNQKVPSLKGPGATRQQLDSLTEFLAGLKARAEPFDLPGEGEGVLGSAGPEIAGRGGSNPSAPSRPDPADIPFNPTSAADESGTTRKARNSAAKADG